MGHCGLSKGNRNLREGKGTLIKVGFYLELIRTVFQAVDVQGKLRNRAVAFTSATPGEGVSHVVNILAKELAAQTQNRILLVDATTLQNLYIDDPNQVSNHCEETEIDNLLRLSAPGAMPNVANLAAVVGPRKAGEWESAPEYRAECLKALRWNFDYVLIDCPSPVVSSDASTLAPLIDGVVVVVKAAQTRRGQIQRCQQVIESAGGNFLGFVLNQRQYPVPNWIYRML
jgi:MinD-like ATPase involved in chromosome partitioning or flagellar assembly